MKSGADFIKVLGSGGGTASTISWLPAFRPEEFAGLVDETHRLGRRITTHCLNAVTMETVIDAGADKLAPAGVAITPTLSVGSYCVQAMHAKETLTPAGEAFLRRWEGMLETSLTHPGRLHEAAAR